MKHNRVLKLNSVQAVKCVACGKLHELDSKEFLSFHGNVAVGLQGGIIGNNLSDAGVVENVTIFCREVECLAVLLQYVKGLDGLDDVKDKNVWCKNLWSKKPEDVTPDEEVEQVPEPFDKEAGF